MKNIYKSLFIAFAFVSFSLGANAQDFDKDPMVNITKQDMQFSIGARFIGDVAYYNTQYTPIKSGFRLVDSRIRASLRVRDWYFYTDMDFSSGKLTQKHIYLQYSLRGKNELVQSFRAGYFFDPTTMSGNTSLGTSHFISAPAPAMALAAKRQLGISYKAYNGWFFAHQGIFAENPYNNQAVGNQGLILSGRWLFIPVYNESNTLQFGFSARYHRMIASIPNPKASYNNIGVPYREYKLGARIETAVDDTRFLSATLPWAKSTFDFDAEFLYINNKFFVRGEYFYKRVNKERDDLALFRADLGSNREFNWQSKRAWSNAYPLKSNNFHGAYLEAGYRIFGQAYQYVDSEAILGGYGKGRSLEVVARYSYTALNDLAKYTIVDGKKVYEKDGVKYFERYVPGRDQFYPWGIIKDYPNSAVSVGGGNLHSITFGVNYAFNQFAQVLLNYTYSYLNRPYYQYDKHFNTLQTRLIFTF